MSKLKDKAYELKETLDYVMDQYDSFDLYMAGSEPPIDKLINAAQLVKDIESELKSIEYQNNLIQRTIRVKILEMDEAALNRLSMDLSNNGFPLSPVDLWKKALNNKFNDDEYEHIMPEVLR